MNRATGTQLHAVIDALRTFADAATCSDDADNPYMLARDAMREPALSALTLLADDIECDGMGGPFATHLSYRISIERDESRKLFFSRLLGNVKRFNKEYGQ